MNEVCERIEQLNEAIISMGVAIFYRREEAVRDALRYIYEPEGIAAILQKWEQYKLPHLQAMRAILMAEKQYLVERYGYEYI